MPNFWTHSQFAGDSSICHVSLNGHYQFAIKGEEDAKNICTRLTIGDNAIEQNAALSKRVEELEVKEKNLEIIIRNLNEEVERLTALSEKP